MVRSGEELREVARQAKTLCGNRKATSDSGFAGAAGRMLLELAAVLERLAAEQEAAQTASSEPDVPSKAVATSSQAEGVVTGSGTASGSLDAEAENWCYYTWPANAGSSKSRTAAFEAANLGSSPSPAVSLDAVADAAQVKSALNELVDYAYTSYTAAAEKVWVEGRAALDRLLAGKAAG